MAQILLEKLDKLKKFEKETMTKYELIDSPEPGKLQFTPFVRTPLTFEFKLDYELSEDGRERMLASPQLLEYGQTAFQCIESVCRPRSAVSLQLPRKKRSDIPGVRPFSAPFNEKGNLQALDNGFMILKLKTPHSREVKKRPKWMPKDTSKILRHSNDFTAEMTGRHGETTVTVGKGDKLNRATIYEESRKQDAEHLGRSDSLPKIDTSRLVKKTIFSRDSDVKEKKLFVPLCIEDEIKKPNAKVIRVDDERAKLSSTTVISYFPHLLDQPNSHLC
ncbi:hypothetical protein lerEdw1_011783 [Lerista edwardsae]|nr:hypothetical protein lerEdw1_011783 [Lerista edwardsae]